MKLILGTEKIETGDLAHHQGPGLLFRPLCHNRSASRRRQIQTTPAPTEQTATVESPDDAPK